LEAINVTNLISDIFPKLNRGKTGLMPKSDSGELWDDLG
jgi:hypothetical protein